MEKLKVKCLTMKTGNLFNTTKTEQELNKVPKLFCIIMKKNKFLFIFFTKFEEGLLKRAKLGPT